MSFYKNGNTPKEILVGRKKYRLRGKKEKKLAKKIIHNQSIKKKQQLLSILAQSYKTKPMSTAHE